MSAQKSSECQKVKFTSKSGQNSESECSLNLSETEVQEEIAHRYFQNEDQHVPNLVDIKYHMNVARRK